VGEQEERTAAATLMWRYGHDLVLHLPCRTGGREGREQMAQRQVLCETLSLMTTDTMLLTDCV
jgi:hypothetical protein